MQRLTDLRETFRVYALCVPCGRMESVDLDGAIGRLGNDSTVSDLRDRVRCRDCGRRTRDVRVVYVGARERPAAFHYGR
jgi:ribosomal protein S14